MTPAFPSSGEDILDVLAREDAGLSVARLSVLTGRDRGLVGRVVDDLCALGLLERTHERRVRLGWALYAAASRVSQERLSSRGQPILDRLAARCGESAYLVARQGSQSVTLAEAMPHLAVQGVSWVGRAQPVARGDAGPLLLMDVGVDVLPGLVGDPLPPTTAPRAPRGVRDLERLIDQARRDLYCVLDELVEPDVTSVAAPVWDFRGRLVAAVPVVGPSARVRRHLDAILSAVVEAAGELTRNLGGTPRTPARDEQP